MMALATQPQYVLAGTSKAYEDLYALYCTGPLTAVREAAASDTRKDPHDSRRAALYFMIAAHPESSAVEQLTRNFDATLDHMTVAYEHHFVGQDAHASAIITGLPGAVNPVKARVVYV
ncbi:hypothetical protein FS749_012613 [Ceratobasidium sp. UAMH 11750]|nr:hypothetical protein FS749_012613 [Ceratobasidium sp. UAMH 11750]